MPDTEALDPRIPQSWVSYGWPEDDAEELADIAESLYEDYREAVRRGDE